MIEQPPLVVGVRRGALIESRHRGSYAVVDVDGRLVEALGNTESPIYARSAIKPLQALPLIETGAADALHLSLEELAIACASHSGETRHIAVVSGWLRRLGLSEADLECGAHLPINAAAARALYATGAQPSALHNNCSGKHSGMLATCLHLREPTRGYIDPEHPAQLRVRTTLSEMCGVDLRDAPRGIDGCGLPQFGIPVRNLALAFARFGAAQTSASDRGNACRRLALAINTHPFLLAGTGRFCTRALEIAKGKITLKTGAEGVYAAAVPARGIGIALKIEDGAPRAAEVLMAALLLRYADLDDEQIASFQPLLRPSVTNVVGKTVGALEPLNL